MRSEKAVKRRHVRFPTLVGRHRFRAVKRRRESDAHWKTSTYYDEESKRSRVVKEVPVREKQSKQVGNQTGAAEEAERASKEKKRREERELKKRQQREMEAQKSAEKKEKQEREAAERKANEDQRRQRQAQDEADRVVREEQEKSARREAKEKKAQEEAKRLEQKKQEEEAAKEPRRLAAEEAKRGAKEERERIEAEQLEAKRASDEQKKREEGARLEAENSGGVEHDEQPSKKSQRKTQKAAKSDKRSQQTSATGVTAEEESNKKNIQQNGSAANGKSELVVNELIVDVAANDAAGEQPKMKSSVDSGVEIGVDDSNGSANGSNGSIGEERIALSGVATPVRNTKQEIAAKEAEMFAQMNEFVTYAHAKLARPQVVHSEQPRKTFTFTMPTPLPPRNIEPRKRERAHRLLPEDVDFCVYMMETYDQDYEAMSKDARNRYHDDARSLQRKLRIFKNSVHFQEYLAEKKATEGSA